MNNMPGSARQRLETLTKDRAELLKLLLESKAKQRDRIPSLPRGDGSSAMRFPASWSQQRLWLIDQLEGGSAAYHIALALRLRGELSESALQRALDTLVVRHEALRTVFASEDGEPRQQINPVRHFALELVDLRSHDPASRESEARLRAREEARRPFDLRTGPLIRGQLLRLARHEHLLLITMHHIVSDGWSLNVLMQEFALLYRAYCEGTTSPLPPLAIQYADYAQWQRGWLRQETIQRQLDYWRARLANAPAELKLPGDRARPAVRSYQGESFPFSIDASLCAELRNVARSHDMTLFMVLYAAWALLLSRLSGQEDIVIGIPVSNRQQPELESLVGFLVNTLALRIQVSAAISLAEFFERVKDATLGAYDHQDVPFEQVVEALRPERSVSRHPLFQVMFALYNAPRSELCLPALDVTLEEDVFDYCKFDLVLSLEEQGELVRGTVSFSTALFDRETVQRWMGYLERLLRAMTHYPSSRLQHLVFVPDEERRQVIETFNTTAAAYPREYLLHEIFEKQVRRTPDALAVIYEGDSLTYERLNERANQLAYYLRERGVGPDNVVGLCMDRGLDIIVGLFAILKAGGGYMPLDPDYPPERLAHMLTDSSPGVVLTKKHLRERVPQTTAEVICLDERWSEVAECQTSDPDAKALGLHPNNLAYALYTSGSTGKPKAVLVEHHNVASLWQGLEDLYRQAAPCERVAVNASFSFDASVKQIIQVLSGRTLVIVPQYIRLDPHALVRFVHEYRIDCIDCTPSQLRLWIAAGFAGEVCPVRAVLVGGEAIDAALWAQLACCNDTRFFNVYGPTESTVDTTAALVNSDRSAPHIGRPMQNRRVYVLDELGRPTPLGVPGEICIGGAGVARGYFRRPELTAARFVVDPFNPERDARMYRTGDLGRWRRNQTVEFLGRTDDQVKVRGFRVELGEIEAHLLKHELVGEAVAVVREDTPHEQRLVAYVAASGTAPPSVEGLRAHLKSVLPDYMVPHAIVVLERLPLSPSGKIDRRRLPMPESSAYVRSPHESPRGEIELMLASIWRDVLNVPRIGRYDNFFELGGHSLSGMKLIGRIVERFDVRLPPMAIFQHPTICQMADAIEMLRSRGATEREDVEYEMGTL